MMKIVGRDTHFDETFLQNGAKAKATLRKLADSSDFPTQLTEALGEYDVRDATIIEVRRSMELALRRDKWYVEPKTVI